MQNKTTPFRERTCAPAAGTQVPFLNRPVDGAISDFSKQPVLKQRALVDNDPLSNPSHKAQEILRCRPRRELGIQLRFALVTQDPSPHC